MPSSVDVVAAEVAHLGKKVDRLIETHEEDREQLRKLVADSAARAPYENDMRDLARRLPERLMAVETSTAANTAALAALAPLPAKVAGLEAVNAQDNRGLLKALISSDDGFLRTTGGLMLAGSLLTAAIGVFGLVGVAAGWWTVSDVTTATRLNPVTAPVEVPARVRPVPAGHDEDPSVAP